MSIARAARAVTAPKRSTSVAPSTARGRKRGSSFWLEELTGKETSIRRLKLHAWPPRLKKAGKTNGGYKLKESGLAMKLVDQRDIIIDNGVREREGNHGTRKATGSTIPVQRLR